MTFAHKPNRGSLFKSDKQNDDDRDYAGRALIGDREWWVSAWISEGKSGRKYLSLSFDAESARPATGGSVKRDMDDEIPFAPEWR